MPEDAALTCAGDELAIMPRNVASRRGLCWIATSSSGYENAGRKGAIRAFYGRSDIAVIISTIAIPITVAFSRVPDACFWPYLTSNDTKSNIYAWYYCTVPQRTAGGSP